MKKDELFTTSVKEKRMINDEEKTNLILWKGWVKQAKDFNDYNNNVIEVDFTKQDVKKAA